MTLTAHQQREHDRYLAFKESLPKTAPIACEFTVGDWVTFTNEAGVFFRKPIQVIGFDNDLELNDRFIYTESDAWWFPSKACELNAVEKSATGCLIVRELTMLTTSHEIEISLKDVDEHWERLLSEHELHTVFVNRQSKELVTFCEGDLIWATALDQAMFDAEIARNVDYFENHL
ncbi:hypothetical protein [Shewanella sp. MBTL60-007]|uniref:hypothetical protein n=1 Tax=Shewanella sp. MBTL60-007 TaxID=2815911 RepID=UPI001BBB2129|nr:hypothetical protein [Shewanella sp. MBTL60-007]GIU21088.1 hypothetical protein TUM3792_21600 [Shewanella sp. MBTL60-007]